MSLNYTRALWNIIFNKNKFFISGLSRSLQEPKNNEIANFPSRAQMSLTSNSSFLDHQGCIKNWKTKKSPAFLSRHRRPSAMRHSRTAMSSVKTAEERIRQPHAHRTTSLPLHVDHVREWVCSYSVALIWICPISPQLTKETKRSYASKEPSPYSWKYCDSPL